MTALGIHDEEAARRERISGVIPRNSLIFKRMTKIREEEAENSSSSTSTHHKGETRSERIKKKQNTLSIVMSSSDSSDSHSPADNK